MVSWEHLYSSGGTVILKVDTTLVCIITWFEKGEKDHWKGVLYEE